MYKKPITQKAKSPLKAVTDPPAPGAIVLQNKEIIPATPGTEGTPGTETSTYEWTGKKDNKVYDALKKEIESGFASRKYGFTGDDVKAYEQHKLGNMKPNENLKVTTVKTEGTPGTPGTPEQEKITETPTYTRDKTDAITPYEDYQNRLIERRAGNAYARSGRKSLNNMAREYARTTDDDGKKGLAKFLSNRKQMREFRRGEVEAGRSEAANFARDVKNRVTEEQLNLDSKLEALKRARNQTKQGASGDDGVISDPRIANQTDLGRADVGKQRDELGGEVSIAKMRYDQNVGIKQRSPMKKGYFKNK